MSETDLPFDLRIESAGRYYSFLEKVKDMRWVEILGEIESSHSYGIPEVLVLLEPRYFEELQALDPRGDKTFTPALRSAVCRSKEVWGYECPFKNSRIHVDHMFPRSKGGLTHAQNAMHLCHEHNLAKHTDIHLILWEQMPSRNQWIEKSLKYLLAQAARLTREKLYLPLSQLSRI